MRPPLLIALIASLALPTAVAAQSTPASERDFCADRPGKGTPTCILDRGRWQVELGLFDGARQTDGTTRTDTWDAGDLFVRYGLTGLTELQLGLTTWNHERILDRATGDRDVADGVGDLSLGLRHSLKNPDGSGLSVAISGFITAPTGARDIRADGFEGGIILPVSIPLNNDWSLSLSPEIDWVSDADGDGRHGAYTMVAGVGRGFGQWDLGAEVWISRDDDPVAPTTPSTFDLTAVWSPPSLPDAQLDFGLNLGLNDDSPDVEFGVGLARRF
ncbi:transporter [Brevundimonas fontaquae]|uniref:Transporter n=1 Tax=Brevundimonas fontaquae TaxID=2813778 RepID=A0ABX7LNY1_9CAUL|nr:transporter [Brevundimonas fontaquae]QSF53061.1 transporter [Brevundimonas fontaquae]